KAEVDLAEKLIEGMSTDWDPSKFQDEYRSALMTLVERKIESGETEPIEMQDEEGVATPQTLNFMDVLKQSVADASKKSKPTSSRRSTSRKKVAKKTKKA